MPYPLVRTLVRTRGLHRLYNGSGSDACVPSRRVRGGSLIASAIHRVRRILSPSKNEISTEATRSAERHRRALLTSATGIAARAGSMGASLVTIPLTLHYLGNERFGLWMTISSVVALATFADFGIGNGVVSSVAAASGKDDLDGIRRAISSAFSILVTIGATLMACFLAIYRLVNWGDLFRATSPHARAEAGPAMLALALCFTLNIPLDIVQRVQFGLQQGFRTNVWQICSSAMSLIGIVLGVHLHLGVPALILAFAGTPVLGAALNSLYFFGVSHRDLVPRWGLVSREMISKIARLGTMFFVIQVVITFSFSTDNFIVARTLGVATVALYSIPQRMFTVISVILITLVMPFWGAYGEAVSRGDMPWVRRTLSFTLSGVLLTSAAASTILLLLSHQILHIWVGSSVQPAFALLLGLAIWEVVRSYTGTLQMFLNGAGILRFQTITHCIFGLACVSAKFWCARHYGVAGVPWAGSVTYTLFIVIPNAIYVPRLLKRMTVNAEPDPLVSYGITG